MSLWEAGHSVMCQGPANKWGVSRIHWGFSISDKDLDFSEQILINGE